MGIVAVLLFPIILSACHAAPTTANVTAPSSWRSVTPLTWDDTCDVDGCLNRCSDKYPGKISDMRATYYCSKGCVHLTAGKIDDRNHYCAVPASAREANCDEFCVTHAATVPESQDECKYGCGFWHVPSPPTPTPPSPPGSSCDPKAHGASTSAEDNAKAIQAALDQCSTGGTVHIDGGAYRTGPLKVHGQGVTLSVSAGSSIVMAYPPKKWPSSDGGMVDVLSFQDCHKCSLTGDGLLHGGGITDQWYYLFDKGEIEDRPLYLHVQDSTDFTLNGHLTLLDAPCFNVLLENVTGAEITGINITSTWYKDPDSGDLKEPHNTDGIDPSHGSSDIWIHDVFIHNGDDSIAVKPSDDESHCTRNVLVENAHFEKGHGCSIGSVGRGCVENVVFRHITMKDQQNGCRAKSYSSTDGDGFIRNITWSDIQMSGTDKCITVNANYKPPPKHPKHYVKVTDLTFSDITGSDCRTTAEFVCPGSAPCEGIELNNVQLDGPSMDCENAHGDATGKVKPSSCL